MASIPHTTPRGVPRSAPTLPRTAGREPMPTTARSRPIAARPVPTEWGVVRRRISRLTMTSAALLTVAVVGLFQVLQTTQVAATGYQVRALEKEQQDLDADIRLLESQIAASSNLDRIHQDATTRLGMVKPQDKVRVAQSEPAPAIVPLPRRYVPEQTHEDAPGVAWWERVLSVIPGMH